MKTKLLLSFFLFTFSFLLCPAQTPQGFNYQAIARDGSGNPIVSSPIKVKLSILSDTAGFGAGTGGAYLWEEEHLNVLTNAYGLFTIVLGDPLATKVDGSAASFSVINWSVSNLYIGTKIANPTTYKVLGAAKLWSVPYALRSGETDQWQANGNNIYRQNGNVGIGTNNPTHKLEVKGGELFLPYNAGNSMLGFSTAFGNSFMLKPLDHALQIQSDHIGNPTIMFMDKSGAIGFGTNTPAYKLDIVGRIRLQTGSGSAGLWLMNTANTTERAFIGMRDDNNISLYGAGGANWGMEMNVNSGNVGIGTAGNPIAKLEVNGDIKSGIIRANAFPGVLNGGYNVGLGLGGGIELTATDGINTFIRFHHSGNSQDDIFYAGETFNFIDRLGQGQPNVRMWGNLQVDGKFGVGTTSSTSKMVIQPPATWDDNTPLFEVRNKYGTPVLAVYNNGVRILVGHDPVKGITKGGFAIGGFDNTKTVGETVNLMTVNPDSVRFNIDNGDTKGITKGGFAIGSFDQAKGIIINSKGFMNLTPSSSANGQYNTFVGYQTGDKNSIGLSNTFLGYQAGLSNTSGDNNIYMGYRAGYNSQLADTNIFIGYEAGFNTRPGAVNTGCSNVYLGNKSGWSNVSGMRNVCIGHEAGYKNTSNLLTAVGYKAGYSSATAIMQAFYGTYSGLLTTGGFNAFFGYSSGYNNTTGTNNTFIGTGAGDNGRTGSYNTSIGGSSGGGAGGGSFGSRNVFVGYTAGYGQTGCAIGDDNVFIGYSTGRKSSNSVGSRNIFIGANTGSSETGNDRLYIDNINTTTPLIYGEFDNNLIRINGNFEVAGIAPVASLFTSSGAVNRKSRIDMYGTFGTGVTDYTARNFAQIEVGCNAAGWSGAYFRIMGRVNDGAPFETMKINTSNGYFYVSSNAYKPGGGSWLATSDERMKDIHGSFKRGLNEILNLNPVYFSYKNGNSRNLPSENEYVGFVAQSVRNYLPEAVISGDDGYLDLDMHIINVALVNAVKEQEAKIEKQQAQIDKLEKIVEEMQAMMAKGEGK